MTKQKIWAYALPLVLALVSCQSQSLPPQIEADSPTAQETIAPQESPLPTSTATSIPTPNPPTETIAVPSLRLELADADWDGERIPDGQQCQTGGTATPSTPSIRVGNIPEGTDALILEFSDEDYGPMDNGGHGKFGFMIAEGASEIVIPPIPGNTFDLPPDFFLVRGHLAVGFATPGAYMPPCSGGANHDYYVTVKAVDMISMEALTYNLLGEGILDLGKY